MNVALTLPPATRLAGGRIAEIECLRGIAILMVLVEHTPINLLYWNGAATRFLWTYGKGWTGVDLFFVISGFVITRHLLPGTIRTTTGTEGLRLCLGFYRRRAWRLLPSAWVWLLVPLLGCLFYNQSGAFRTLTGDVASSVAGFLDLANFHMAEIFGRGDPGMTFPYWSLSLEEQFYLGLPIALLCLRGATPVLLALMLLTSLQVPTPLANLTRTSSLACGVLLAWGWHHWPEALAQMRPAALAARLWARWAFAATCVLLLVILGSDALHIVWFRQLPVALVCAALVWAASYDGGLLWSRGPSRRVMEWIGSRSYALYLVHIPLFAAAHETFCRLAPGRDHPQHLWAWAYLLGAWASCFAVADLNYRLLETPLRRRGQTRMSAPPGLPASQAAAWGRP